MYLYAELANSMIVLIFEESARLDAQHQAATSALGTINAYWGLRAAQENVAIAQRSVDLQAQTTPTPVGSAGAAPIGASPGTSGTFAESKKIPK